VGAPEAVEALLSCSTGQASVSRIAGDQLVGSLRILRYS
jgi:hypothetical protein